MPPNASEEQVPTIKTSVGPKSPDFEPGDRPGNASRPASSLEKFFTPEARGIMARMSGKVSEFTTRLYEKVVQSNTFGGGRIERKMGALAARMDIWFSNKLEQGVQKAKAREAHTIEREERKVKRLTAESEAADQAFAKMQEISRKIDQPLSAATEVVFADKRTELQTQTDAAEQSKAASAQRVADAEDRFKNYRAEVQEGAARLTKLMQEKVKENTAEILIQTRGIAKLDLAVQGSEEAWKKEKQKLETIRASLLDPSLGDYREELEKIEKKTKANYAQAQELYTTAKNNLSTIRAKIEMWLNENKAHREGTAKIEAKYLTDAERKTRKEQQAKDVESQAQAGEWEAALKLAGASGDFALINRIATIATERGEGAIAEEIISGIPASERPRSVVAEAPKPKAPEAGRKLPPPPPPARLRSIPRPDTPPPIPTGVASAPRSESRPAGRIESRQEGETKTLQEWLSEFMGAWNLIHTKPEEQITLNDLKCDDPNVRIESGIGLAIVIKNIISGNKPGLKLTREEIPSYLVHADADEAAAA